MFYEIIHKDGSVSRMTLGDVPTTPEAEVAKWPEEMRLSVKEIRKVEAHTAAMPAPLPEAAAALGLPSEARDMMIELAEALALANRKIAALEQTAATHDATFEALKGAV